MLISYLRQWPLAGPLLGALGVARSPRVGLVHQRLRRQNRRWSTALDNMSQGLCMFDGQGRIVVVQPPLYRDVQAVAARSCGRAAALRALIQHRKDTGLFAGDVDDYCQKIFDAVRTGTEHKLLCAGERRPHRAGQERAAAGRRLGLHP